MQKSLLTTFFYSLQMYDDLDLPFAKLRLLPKGGHGGHNGYSISHLLFFISVPCIAY
jgi:peptidyl-tRNA hydrolase